MKVEIRDWKALSSLSLSSLRSYLTSHGWIDGGAWGGGSATIFFKESGGRAWDVLVPMQDAAADYAYRMGDAVTAIASVEERSQIDVFYDLARRSADVIRVCSTDAAVSSGVLSVRKSAGLMRDVNNMLASAARAVHKPQPSYRGRFDEDVTSYLENVHPIASHYEGYAVTLHSPAPVAVGARRRLFQEPPEEAPFSRLATRRLSEALQHASAAVSSAIAEDTLDHFDSAVSHGVSANLCDSVAALAKGGRGIAIDIGWADVRPSDMENSHFLFSENSADILLEAAKSFRRYERVADERIIAHVVGLERELDEFDGRAAIACVLDGRLIRMNVEFDKTAYDAVIEAFRARSPISVIGDIERSGARYYLGRPRGVSPFWFEPPGANPADGDERG